MAGTSRFLQNSIDFSNDAIMKIIDLTHPLSDKTPSWEGSCSFSISNYLDYYDCNTEVKFRVESVNMPAGIGTHMDAPAHCVPKGKTIDAIDLSDCIAPCIVVDISAKADATYRCTVQDILDFEANLGKIEADTFVIIYTGWSRYWPEPKKYRNHLRFPSILACTSELLFISTNRVSFPGLSTTRSISASSLVLR